MKNKLIESLRKTLSEEHNLIYVSDIDLTDNSTDEDIDIYYKQLASVKKVLNAAEKDIVVYVDYDGLYCPSEVDEVEKVSEDKVKIVYRWEDTPIVVTVDGSEYPWIWFANEGDAEKYLSFVDRRFE